MANNLGVSTGVDATIKTTDNAGIHTVHHNIEVAGTAPALNTGTRSASTLRVTQATDDVVHVDDNSSSLTVDNAVLSVVGGGTEATAQRVTIASDSTGVLSVDDNGNSLTVDGTVAATQSGTWTVQPGNTANTTPWLTKIHDGTNAITLVQNAATTNDWAVPVMIHPDSVNANGRASAANSAPITLSNEDFASLEGRRTSFVRGMTSAMTGTTSTSLLSAAGASTFNYITAVTVSNTHSTQGTEIVLQDGNGGTAFWTFPAAPAYGGATINFNPPLKQPTANTALFCANLTSGASTKVSVNGFTGV